MGNSCVDDHKVQASRFDTRNCGEKRCLCCLPIELLLVVLSYLSILDYLSFRAVCKCWRSAFSKCSAFISQKQSQRRLPWFLLLRFEEFPAELPVSQNKQHFLQTTGKFGDLSSRCIYNTDIPELCETRLLLSRHGWLLLFSSKNGFSSLFFLNPFSRARINIPLMDVTKLCHPVFGVSAPPTSPDCVVFAISCHDLCVEITTCRRGESTWKSNSYKNHRSGGHVVVNTVFVNGIWYCLHECGSFGAFDAINCCWRFLGLPDGMDRRFPGPPVSYVVKRGTQVYMCVHGVVFYEVLLEEPLKVTRNLRDEYWQFHVEYLMRTQPERAIEQLQNQIEVSFDNFNAHAWCVTCNNNNTNDNDDGIAFRWHQFRSCVNVRFEEEDLDERSCLVYNKECSTIVAWIEPAWAHPSADLSWML